MATIIDTSNPITSGLLLAYADSTDYSQSITPTNSSGTFGSDATGDYWQKGAADSYLSFGDIGLGYTSGGYDTFTVVVKGLFQGGGFNQGACSWTDPTSNVGWAVKHEQSSGNTMGVTFLGVADITTSTAVAVDTTQVIGWSRSQSGVRTAKEGVASALTGANTSNAVGNATTFTVGGTRKNNTFSDDMQDGDKFYEVFVWNRELTQAELESVTADTSQLFTTDVVSTTITTDIPSDIDLKWGETYDLDVTHDGGTTTLSGVTLEPQTGWEYVNLASLNPNAGTDYLGGDVATLEYHARTDTGLGGGGYTAVVGDQFAWTTSTGLTFDGQTVPVVDPAATVTGSYKVWSDALQSWSATSTYTITDDGIYTGGADLTAIVQPMVSNIVKSMVN